MTTLLWSSERISAHPYTNTFILYVGCAFGLYLTIEARTYHHGYRTLQEKRFGEWLSSNARQYKDNDEWMFRFGVYKSNLEFINFMNAQNLSFNLRDNGFADMTNDEFRLLYLGNPLSLRSPSMNANYTKYNRMHKASVPSHIDWRKRGAVTSVKSQGSCGSCWAFSAVAAVEGLNKIKTGRLISLSEQELVDCDTKGPNKGCSGGFMADAFKYIARSGGISTTKQYPYKAKRERCSKSKGRHKAARITGYRAIPEKDEAAIKAAVAKQPVSVAIDADGYAFQLYGNGVFSGFCGRKMVNHAVTIVGYGEEDEKYWIVKNSWGTNWGEHGYIRMKRDRRDKRGTCGINMLASYPVKRTTRMQQKDDLI